MRTLKQKEYAKKYYAANREKLIAATQAWTAANKQRKLEYCRKWRAENKDRVRENNKRWTAANRERHLRLTADWIKRNPERYRAAQRIRHEKYYRSPQGNLATKLGARLGKLVRGLRCDTAAIELVGCSRAALQRHIERQFKGGMSWENAGEWHIDHIRPCASFDLTAETGRLECFHFTNLRPIWRRENLSKNSKRIFLL